MFSCVNEFFTSKVEEIIGSDIFKPFYALRDLMRPRRRRIVRKTLAGFLGGLNRDSNLAECVSPKNLRVELNRSAG